MSTKIIQKPGLLPRSATGQAQASQGQKPKPPKVTTTVRIDADLKARAEEFARANHMDFSTFLTFSLHTTIQNGGKIEPVWHVSPAYAERLKEIDKDIEAYDRGELEGVAGPFSGDEAIAYLKTLY